MQLKETKSCEIYTDASFDDNTKLATYSIVITSQEKVLEVFSKRCKLNVEKSTECEIFAIYQAMSLILAKYLVKNKYQEFLIKTDCQSARNFFVCKDVQVKVFEYNPDISVMMLNVYKKLCKKLSGKNRNFEIKWISEKENKLAHQYTYSTFQKVKKDMKQLNKNSIKDEIVVLEKKHLLKIINELSANQRKVLCYFIERKTNNGMIKFNEEDVAENLNLSKNTATRAITVLKNLNIIGISVEKKCEILI